MKLWVKILLGLAVGVLVGWFIQSLSADPAALHAALNAKPSPAELPDTVNPYIFRFFQACDVGGTLFLRLITMLIVPLVFASMTCGVTSIQDTSKLKRVGLKTLGLYLGTTIVAVMIGLGFAYLFKPGANVSLLTCEKAPVMLGAAASSGWQEGILNIFPKNIVASMANADILPCIVFAVFFGLAINVAGKKAKPVLDFLEALSESMYSLTALVMRFAPYGVACAMAYTVGLYGLAILLSLGKFLIAVYAACIFHALLVFCGILIFMARVSPFPFFRGMRDAIILAASTNSSSCTLPVSMRCAIDNLGVSKTIANFSLPLGATINMNGAAIFQGIGAYFIAEFNGIELSSSQLLIIVCTATLSAVGAAGIPGSGWIMLNAVTASVGIVDARQGMTAIFGIDRVREMMTTVMNVLGDAVVAVYVAKTEGELDLARYNAPDTKVDIS